MFHAEELAQANVLEGNPRMESCSTIELEKNLAHYMAEFTGSLGQYPGQIYASNQVGNQD